MNQHLKTILIWVVIFVVVFGYVGFLLYSVPFNAFVNNCTGTDAAGNLRADLDGTVLTRNAFNLAFNYATHEARSP